MKKFSVVIVAIALAVFSGSVFAQSFTIDAGNSKVRWDAAKVTGEHNGLVNLKDGSLSVDGYNLTGMFTVDMTSISVVDIPADNEMNGKLAGHLKSPDFFSVEEHPSAMFKITKTSPKKVTEDSKANYLVTGNLTIKGITHEVTFPAVVTVDGNKLTAEAVMTD